MYHDELQNQPIWRIFLNIDDLHWEQQVGLNIRIHHADLSIRICQRFNNIQIAKRRWGLSSRRVYTPLLVFFACFRLFEILFVCGPKLKSNKRYYYYYLSVNRNMYYNISIFFVLLKTRDYFRLNMFPAEFLETCYLSDEKPWRKQVFESKISLFMNE
jgi:hypothetical protein